MERKLIIKICPKCKAELNDENNILVFSICDDCHKNRKTVKLRKKCDKCGEMHDHESSVNFMPFLQHLI